MRVVSLVPSWTETLLQAGVDVVGRTRFCIHPAAQVRGIPVIGGTKDWNFEAIKALKPDLLILDREENPKFMAEQDEIPILATHVDSVNGVGETLAQMSIRMSNKKLNEFAAQWQEIGQWPGLPRWEIQHEIPGIIEWGRRPGAKIRSLIYVIWRNPWMAVSQDTFIGSVLEKCGFASYLPTFSAKYPVFDLGEFPAQETLLFFSSEPYPFLKKKEILDPIVNPFAFVNGESFSWFGVRTLSFLQQCKMRGQ